MITLLARLLVLTFCIALALPVGFRTAAFVRELSDVSPPSVGDLIPTPLGAIFVQSAGPADGTPVLFVHGSAAWSGFWADEIARFGNKGYRAIAFDMPPFGFSQRATDGDYSRPAQARRILALTKALDIRPILVAHSFGAAAAAEAVLMNPDAFAGLVIIDGAIGLAAAPVDKQLPAVLRPDLLRQAGVSLTATNPLITGVLLRGLLYNKASATPAHLDTLRLPLGRPGTTAAYADWLPSLLAPQSDVLSRNPDNYANMPLRVEIIWGDKDTVTPPTQAEALAIALGQGPVTYLEDVGHIPHIEAPMAFADALERALMRIAP